MVCFCPFRPRRKAQGGVRPFRWSERGANGVSGVCAGMGGAMGLRRGDSRIAPTFGYSPPVTAVIWNWV